MAEKEKPLSFERTGARVVRQRLVEIERNDHITD